MEILSPDKPIIERLPFERYVDLPGEHATELRDILVSPLQYHRRKDKPRPDSDALRVGRAGHTAILEPDRFMFEYVVWRADEDVACGPWRSARGVDVEVCVDIFDLPADNAARV